MGGCVTVGPAYIDVIHTNFFFLPAPTRASVPVTLLTLATLRKLLIEHYDALDGETRALVLLKRFYWPVV